MKINLITFGSVKDITRQSRMVLEEIKDTDSLRRYLLKHYPAMEFINYAIAVNEEIVSINSVLKNGAIVAILPPFSGG